MEQNNLMVAAQNGDFDEIIMLINTGINLNVQDIAEMTVLMYASRNGRV